MAEKLCNLGEISTSKKTEVVKVSAISLFEADSDNYLSNGIKILLYNYIILNSIIF